MKKLNLKELKEISEISATMHASSKSLFGIKADLRPDWNSMVEALEEAEKIMNKYVGRPHYTKSSMVAPDMIEWLERFVDD